MVSLSSDIETGVVGHEMLHSRNGRYVSLNFKTIFKQKFIFVNLFAAKMYFEPIGNQQFLACISRDCAMHSSVRRDFYFIK